MFKSNYTVMEMIFQYYPPGFEAFFAIMIGVLIAALVISVVMMVWVYKDAKKRNMNAAVWLLIVFVAGCCGCVIYLMVREPEQPQGSLYQQQPSLSQHHLLFQPVLTSFAPHVVFHFQKMPLFARDAVQKSDNGVI